MAIDPRISLTPAPTINVGQRFNQALTNLKNVDLLNQLRDLAPLQLEQAQRQAELEAAQQPALLQQAEFAAGGGSQLTNQQQQAQQIATSYATALRPLLNNPAALLGELQRQKQQFQDAGVPTQGIDEDIAQIQTPEGLALLGKEINDTLTPASARSKPDVATRSFAPITDPQTGQVSLPTFDPNTGEAKLVPIEGARKLTLNQEQQQELKQFTTKEKRKARLSRSKEIKKGLGDRNRSAARSQQPLFEALRLASNPRTSEGLAAGIQTQLARVLPGIDVSNEGNLDSALNRLALEQLQNFKGPTTDFEFGVTQNIVGSLTDPREANVSRLKSLQRANWFAKREFRQFNDFIGGGGEPDDFAFNFNESVQTKKGEFTLKDLQDTAVDNNLTIEEVIERLDQ